MTTTESDPVAHARATDLSQLPEKMQRLPVYKGIPVPFFVYVDGDGKPDHRIVDAKKYGPAVNHRLCWVCGQKLGAIESYAVGPMCTINRISGEPGQHTECSEWSARHCPFLTTPGRGRREAHLPGEVKKEPLMSPDNPGVMAVWSTRHRPLMQRTPDGAPIFMMGEPISVDWYTLGRRATPAEAAHAFDLGVERLMRLAGEGGADDMDYAYIANKARDARKYLP